MAHLGGKQVLVTGAHGLIGQRVVRALVARGATPLSVVHGKPRMDMPGEQVSMDLLSSPNLAAIMQRTDYVVHLAARSGGAGFQSTSHGHVFRYNNQMTQVVLDAACKSAVRRVFLASSAVVYRDHGVDPLTEQSPLLRANEDAPSGYAWSKVTDELLGRWASESSGPQVVVGRFTNVYAPEGALRPQPSTVVHALIRRAFESRSEGKLHVWGDGTPVRSFLHADDAAVAVATVLAHGEAGGVYNLDSTEAVPIGGLAELVRHQVDPRLRIQFIPSLGWGKSRVLDSGRLRNLGFVPQYSLPRGIAEAVTLCRGQI